MTLCQTQRSEKAPRNFKPVPKRARSTALPGPHSGAGRVRRPGGMPRATTGPPLLVSVKKPPNTTEGENKNNRKKQPKHPCRLASRERPQKGRASSSPVSTRRIPKTRGVRNGTPKNHQEARRTAKKGDKPSAAGKNKTRACGGVLLLPELCLLKRNEKRKDNKRRRRKKPKGERPNPKKQNLTARDFAAIFGAKRQNIKQKHKQNSTKKKHKTSTDPQKDRWIDR